MHASSKHAVACVLVLHAPSLIACSSSQPAGPIACDWFPGQPAARSNVGLADAGAPPPVLPKAVSVGRGEGPCDLATLAIQVESSGPARTSGDFTYSLKLLSGTVPHNLTLPSDPVPAYECCGIPSGGSCLSLAWSDDALPHGAFSFRVTVKAVDTDGRQSHESEPVTIANDGTSDHGGGCI